MKDFLKNLVIIEKTRKSLDSILDSKRERIKNLYKNEENEEMLEIVRKRRAGFFDPIIRTKDKTNFQSRL